MQLIRSALLLALAAQQCGAMRHPARGVPEEGSNHSSAPEHLTPAQQQQKVQLRSKLTTVLHALQGMIEGQGGLSKAKVAPALQVFVHELGTVLAAKDVPLARLTDAEEGMKTLMHELSKRQEALMMEEENQHESLLLGVLMSKQKEPMAEQVKVLSSPDFAKLPVSKALLAKHNNSLPLYAQVAAYLDGHQGKESLPSAQQVSAAELRRATSAKLAASLEKRVESMEKELKAKEAAHKRRAAALAREAKSGRSAKARHLARAIQSKEARAFKKFAAVRAADLASMKGAVDAVKKGDMKALERARSALMASLKALKDQNGGFLVLLSVGHKTMGGDCPYCAAQCIDKCRQVGNSYAKCLGDCADAGKDF